MDSAQIEVKTSYRIGNTFWELNWDLPVLNPCLLGRIMPRLPQVVMAGKINLKMESGPMIWMMFGRVRESFRSLSQAVKNITVSHWIM